MRAKKKRERTVMEGAELGCFSGEEGEEKMAMKGERVADSFGFKRENRGGDESNG